jgi:hypothetical protein
MGDALRERVLRAWACDPRTKDMNLLLGRHTTQMECASLTVTEARYVVHLAHEISPPLLGNQPTAGTPCTGGTACRTMMPPRCPRFASILIISLDDVGFVGNQSMAQLADDFVLVNSFLFGTSLRATDNRWEEPIPNAN